MTGHPAWTPKALFWAGWQLCTGFLLSPVVNSKRSGEDLRFSGGGPPSQWTPFESPVSPCHLHPRWTLCRGWLPCHHPSHPPALPPAHGLPSRGLAGGGSDGVRQSPRLPDGEPPPTRRPKWREGRQLPRPRPLFVWRGGGELRLAPGAAGLCQSLPRLGLPGPRTLRTLSAMLGDAALTPSLVFSLASCSPALRSPCVCRRQWA